MAMRYVQSKYSTEAPKLEVRQELPETWIIVAPSNTAHITMSVSKFEYVEVSAPERWERIAASNQLQVLYDGRTLWLNNTQFFAPNGYRWAWDKQEDGTLCIERKVGL